MKIQNTRDVKPKICALVAGKPGVGKTTLAGTLKGKTLIISAEAGLLALSGKSIDFIEIEGADDLEKWEHFRKAISWAAKSDYDNIFVDSLTEISEFILAACDKEFPEARNAMQKWGMYTATIKKLIRYFRDMHKNTFIVTLQKVDKDEVGKRYYAPDISGKMAEKIPAYFDLVLDLKILQKDDEEVRAIQTFTDSGYVCKDRSGKLARYEKPDLSLILDKIGGKIDSKKIGEVNDKPNTKGEKTSSNSSGSVQGNPNSTGKNSAK